MNNTYRFGVTGNHCSVLLFTVLLLFLTGCTTSPEYIALHPVYRMKVINTFKIAAVAYQTPPVSMEPVKADSGSGSGVKIANWQDLSDMLALPDFTAAINRQLVRGMSARAGLKNLHVDTRPLPLPHRKDLVFYKKQYSDSNYVMEVMINNLAIETGDFGGNTHALKLHAQAQMIRQYYSKVIWKYHCLIDGAKNNAYAWKSGDFYARDGARIKQAVSQAVVDCANAMVNDYLNYNK